MPELPEVETVRMQLCQYVCGKTIAKVVVHHPKTVACDETFDTRLHMQTIRTIDRIGKLLIFSFVEGDLFLLAHLKMTGQFFYRDSKHTAGGGHTFSQTDITTLPNRHTRVSFSFTDGSQLHFNDQRLFGYVHIADRNAVAQARARFGAEPIAPNFDQIQFATELRRRRAPVKAILLDQTFVAGLGNIYVDETLWRVKVRPTRRGNRITRIEAHSIATVAGTILHEAIAVGGTTFQHFADTNGDTGNFTSSLAVFGKQGLPCPRCNTLIKKVRCAGRGTHFCPRCQR